MCSFHHVCLTNLRIVSLSNVLMSSLLVCSQLLAKCTTHALLHCCGCSFSIWTSIIIRILQDLYIKILSIILLVLAVAELILHNLHLQEYATPASKQSASKKEWWRSLFVNPTFIWFESFHFWLCLSAHHEARYHLLHLLRPLSVYFFKASSPQ